MCLKVLAEELVAATAVEALAAELRVVGNDALADLEPLDFGSDGRNDTDRFVAYRCGSMLVNGVGLSTSMTYQAPAGTNRSALA